MRISILSFLCFFLFASSYSQTNYRIGFRLLNRVAGEHYVIRVNTPPESNLLGEPYFLDVDSTAIVYTPAIYPTGISIFFIQESGPRTCYFNGNVYGTVVIGRTDAIIELDCGTTNPPVNDRAIILTTTKPGEGESFDFIIEKAGRRKTNLTVTSNNFQNLTTQKLFSRRDTIQFIQTSGPRACNIASNYIIPDTGDLHINLNCGFPQTPIDRAVILTTSKPGPGESFEFIIEKNNRRITTLTVTANNYQNISTTKLFAKNDTLRFIQSMGPRVCNVARSYIIPETGNLNIALDCGAPPPPAAPRDRTVILSVLQVGLKDTFGFEILYHNQMVGGSVFIDYYHKTESRGSFAKGDTIRIRAGRTSRPCTIQPFYVIPETGNLNIALDCGAGAPGIVGADNEPSQLNIAGTFVGPAGSQIVIRSGKNEELTVTAGAKGTSGFRFPKEYTAGEPYTISIKQSPPNCNCVVLPAASGNMPSDSNQVNIICNQAIELVSRSTDDKTTNSFYEASSPVVGGRGADEGRFVAFVSSGAGLDGSSGKYRQIYLRDMRSNTIKMISRGPDGSEGNNNSFLPSISLDGRSVAFESYATNLAGGDNNGVRDVYVWKDGRINWVSQGGNGESFEPAINGDGSAVVFSSSASTLTAGVDGTSTVNVIMADGGSFILLTKDPNTGKGVGGSAPQISANGNIIVFSSYSDKLVTDDRNSLWDIFIWKKGMPGLKRISITDGSGDRDLGTESASRVVSASISGLGNYIVYSTTATNMVSGDNNKMLDIFICNNNGLAVKKISVAANNTEGDGDSPIDQGGRIGISYDGTWVCYNTNATNLGVAKGNIILQNTRTGKIIPLTNSIYNSTGRPMISATGAFVVAGCSEKMDKRFTSSGIFEFFTGPLISNTP